MENDRYLPMEGIPKSKLLIEPQSGLHVAVRKGRQDILKHEDVIANGGKREFSDILREYTLYTAKPVKNNEPKGY